MDGIPKFVSDGNLTPDFYAVNTMQPPYQPSANPPAEGGDPAYADPAQPTTLPPQTEPTIGDLLSLKGVSWAWYGGAWQYALDNGNSDAGAELPVPPPAVQLLRELRAGHRRRAPSICATAASAARASSRRSTPASCRRSPSTSRRATSTSTPATPTSQSGDAAHRRRGRATWRRARSGSTCWSSSPTTRTAASGTTSRRRRATAGARARAFRRSSSRPSPRRASSITRPTTRPRSCASSPTASSCRSCAASWCATRRSPPHGEPPLGDLTSALDLGTQG